MLNAFLLLALLPQQAPNLVDAVDSQRGGRHWIDEKPDPPKTPEETLATFRVEPGSRIELVAAEPLVFDPVWMDFDHRGRMFVAEYSDYPIGPVNADGTANEDAAPLSKIVMLEDKDADGRVETRTVFADKLKFCHSFLPLMDGILACCQTQILFLRDTDGDNIADVREVWFDGFTPAHPQMQIGCPRWGRDNWIYLTYAPGNVSCLRKGFETKEPIKLPRQDMRFDPLTMKFEPVTGLGQFGQTIDNDGNRFFCTNRNPIMMEVIPQWAAGLNPDITVGKRHADVGPSGGETRVYPLVEMKSNWLEHAGTHTSACGVTAYRGHLWDHDFQHSVFVCEPIGHLVTRSIVERSQSSAVLTARRAEPKADFVASSDTWFRPGSLRTGPDGALYIADMYRMWVEHPKFLPPEIAAQIDWREGEDRGRIWRVVPDDDDSSRSALEKFEPPTTSQDLVDLLKHPNGWQRTMAQQRLVESRADKAVAEQLRTLLESEEPSTQSRIQALWTLAGRDELIQRDFGTQFRMIPPKEQINLLSSQMVLAQKPLNFRAARSAARSNDGPLRLQAVLQAAQIVEKSTEFEFEGMLSQVLMAGRDDPWFTEAVLLSAKGRYSKLLQSYARSQANGPPSPGKFRTAVSGTAVTESTVYRLAELVGRTGSELEIRRVLEMVPYVRGPADWISVGILKGLGKGMPRNATGEVPKTLEQFLNKPPEPATKVAAEVTEFVDELTLAIDDSSQSPARRQAAVELLTLWPKEEMLKAVDRLLVPTESGGIQQATLEVVQQAGGKEAADVVLSRWQNLTPTVRSDALRFLVSRTDSTSQLLQSMVEGTVAPSVIDLDQRLRLMKHRDADIQELAKKVFGGVVSANRKAVADDYQPALTMAASAERGAAIFEKTCSKCHKINGKGHNVGPDISDTRRRSRDALLYDILDPNRRVDPQFTEYIVVTKRGRTMNGLLVSDSNERIVLRQPEGKETQVDRDDIDEVQATSKSLMPEGIEKDLNTQQMADLLEFLKNQG